MKYPLLTFAALLLPLTGSAVSEPATKPNINFILADDLGIRNVSCCGADNYKTPHIDKLATEGRRFTHAYTAPLCGPSGALRAEGAAAKRFDKFDVNKDGFVTREEYISNGAKKLK